nr:MAG TPA: hypothetical protein [Caudoviricetes sp.]
MSPPFSYLDYTIYFFLNKKKYLDKTQKRIYNQGILRRYLKKAG